MASQLLGDGLSGEVSGVERGLEEGGEGIWRCWKEGARGACEGWSERDGVWSVEYVRDGVLIKEEGEGNGAMAGCKGRKDGVGALRTVRTVGEWDLRGGEGGSSR